jgi:hypothetical protein
MVEVRRKYDLRPRLNTSTFRREDAVKGSEIVRRDVGNGVENSKKDVAL